jgi:hypothetical protein
MIKNYFAVTLLLSLSSLHGAMDCLTDATCSESTKMCCCSNSGMPEACCEAARCPCNKPLTKDELSNIENRCPCNKPPKKDMGAQVLMDTLLQDNDIKMFYTALSADEMMQFEGFIRDTVMINEKLSDNISTVLHGQDQKALLEAAVDRSVKDVQDELTNMSSRYETLIQKITGQPQIAKTLALCLEQHMANCCKDLNITL